MFTIMFMIVDSLHLKQIQTNQREELTEIRKSNMEIQCVKPQTKYETTQTKS